MKLTNPTRWNTQRKIIAAILLMPPILLITVVIYATFNHRPAKGHPNNIAPAPTN